MFGCEFRLPFRDPPGVAPRNTLSSRPEKAASRFRRAGTKRSRSDVSGSRVSQEGSPGMTAVGYPGSANGSGQFISPPQRGGVGVGRRHVTGDEVCALRRRGRDFTPPGPRADSALGFTPPLTPPLRGGDLVARIGRSHNARCSSHITCPRGSSDHRHPDQFRWRCDRVRACSNPAPSEEPCGRVNLSESV